jgi:hypothetical protein
MILSDLLTNLSMPLLEAKARIEHPEDMILDQGVKGAHTALNILKATADQPQHVSTKFDGSPSLIMGWRGDEFILTDKAGFSAKGYDGMTTSAHAIESMIMNRKIKDTSPEAIQARKSYAKGIAGLYDRLKQVVPKSFQGFAQGDLMWTRTPPLVAGAYEFSPVKIKYQVPADSDLGKQIGASDVGMVIHSVYDSPQDEEPQALRRVSDLGFKNTAGVVILPHDLELEHKLNLHQPTLKKAIQLLKTHGTLIQEFLDPVSLTDQEIKALPNVMKSFVAHKAGKGEQHFDRAPEEFIEYVQSPMSKVSAKMAPRIISWIQDHVDAYNAIWQFVQLMVDLKLDLKQQIDSQVSDTIGASLNNKSGHEGFVSVTPEGIVKLVNRAEFMKKELMESQHAQLHRVVFSFLRANPPTPGHVKVMQAVAQHAQGHDYWIFLSHSQDAKKNPLSWDQKAHYLGKLSPKIKSHLALGAEFDKIKTPLLAMDWLYDQGYRNITMVVGSDRVESMREILTGWNSDAIRQKYKRELVQITVLSAGDRDPDADDVTGISASKMRAWAQSGDQHEFVSHSGLPEADAVEMYDLVRKGMKLNMTKIQENAHASGTIVKLRLSPHSAQQLREWCQQQNVECMDPEHLHMTVLFSHRPMPMLTSLHETNTRISAQVESWKQLGETALTLKLHAPHAVKLHEQIVKLGATHSWPDFIPHTSVNYVWHKEIPLPAHCPKITLLFDQIQVEAIDPNWSSHK